jgi:hypothetical protein
MAFQRRKAAAIGTKAPYRGFIEPALAISIEKVPSGKRWVHEIKFDGYQRSNPSERRRGQGLHPARQRLDQPLSQDRCRRVAHQCRVGDHRRRGSSSSLLAMND